MPNDTSLGDRMFASAAKGWRDLWGAENLPLDKRVYIDSAIDRRTNPVTERLLNADEQAKLRDLIMRRYDAIKPQLTQELAESRSRAADALQRANAVKNDPGMRRIYLDQYKSEAENINGISSYLASGHINPTVVRIGGYMGVKPNIQYKDYDTDDTSRSLLQTLGRFTYDADANGNITVKDSYDFNAADAARKLKVSDLINPSYAAYVYGAKRLPPGKGRPVNIRINSMAPPKPKEQPNWFSKAAAYLGF